MKRFILVAMLTALVGCDDKKKDSPPATKPSAEDMFDKGKAPGGKGKIG